MIQSSASLEGREVVLVVAGGIAAFKSAIVAREIRRRGGAVETVLTEAAQHFVGAATFSGITGRPARTDLWDPANVGEVHIELTARADLVIVAPATADILARAAQGLANDLATTVLVSASSPVLMAPAMHARMWAHEATQTNVATLRARGVAFVGPVDGPLASGENGLGRMSEPEAIVDAACDVLRADMRGLRILVTAGPTHEPLDPVRFVGNRSSGKMGAALAERARARGADVRLVHGPMTAAVPAGIRATRVNTALDMRDAVAPDASGYDAIVMAAAVADYRPAEVSPTKIAKTEGDATVKMVRNPDILAALGVARGEAKRPVLVGFALETGDLVAHARAKLAAKRCDLMVANLAEHGFEGDQNVVTLVTHDSARPLGRLSKREVADRILDEVLLLLVHAGVG